MIKRDLNVILKSGGVMKKILLFIPIYNCKEQIIRVLEQIGSTVEKYIYEIIIIDNRSTDEGIEKILNYMKNNKKQVKIKIFVNDENYGLGGSHKVAFSYAQKNYFDYVVILHGDDQANINDIIPYLENKEYQNYDCFLGSRFMRESKLEGYSKFRTFGNKVYNILFSIFLRRKIYDLGSGLNCYKVEILKNKFYFHFPDNLLFNYCMILASDYYQHKIKFFPISWKEYDQVSNVKMTSQALKVLKYLFSFTIDRKQIKIKDFRSNIIEDYTSHEQK